MNIDRQFQETLASLEKYHSRSSEEIKTLKQKIASLQSQLAQKTAHYEAIITRLQRDNLELRKKVASKDTVPLSQSRQPKGCQFNFQGTLDVMMDNSVPSSFEATPAVFNPEVLDEFDSSQESVVSRDAPGGLITPKASVTKSKETLKTRHVMEEARRKLKKQKIDFTPKYDDMGFEEEFPIRNEISSTLRSSQNSQLNQISSQVEVTQIKAEPQILDVDLIIARVEQQIPIEISKNPLNGKRWVLEDFKPVQKDYTDKEFSAAKEALFKEVLEKFEQDLANKENIDKSSSQQKRGTSTKQKSTDDTPHIMDTMFSKSPPGFFRTGFPNTQEIQNDRAESKRRENARTLCEFLVAVNYLEMEDRLYEFKNKLFERIIVGECFDYDLEVLKDIYPY